MGPLAMERSSSRFSGACAAGRPAAWKLVRQDCAGRGALAASNPVVQRTAFETAPPLCGDRERLRRGESAFRAGEADLALACLG